MHDSKRVCVTSLQALGPISQKQFASHVCAQITNAQVSDTFVQCGSQMLMHRLQVWLVFILTHSVNKTRQLALQMCALGLGVNIKSVKHKNITVRIINALTHRVCSVSRQQPAPVPQDTHRCTWGSVC